MDLKNSPGVASALCVFYDQVQYHIARNKEVVGPTAMNDSGTLATDELDACSLAMPCLAAFLLVQCLMFFM